MTLVLDATDSQMVMLADLVDALRVAEETLAGMQAARDGMLAMASRLAIDIAQQAAHPDHGDMALRTVAAEIGAAQRISDRTIERRMSEASWLVEEFPSVWAAQGAGRISAAHARVIVEAGAHLDDPAHRAGYAASALEVAAVESPNRLRRLARRIAEAYQAQSMTDRHRDARDKRRVWLRDVDDGMSELGVYGPSTLLHGMYDRLSQMAHVLIDQSGRGVDAVGAAAGPDEASDATRSVDHLSADLLADIVLTGIPSGHDSAGDALGAIRARVEVTVPVLTLMGAADPLGGSEPAHVPAPAELDGRTPIDIDTARRLAGGASGWERVLTHPISGALLAVDRYRPGDQLKRHLRARDQRCRFPGCGIAARKCDIDHNHAASDGGPTCAENLAHFCRRHHVMKHRSPWRVTQTAGGALEWRSPTGQVYVDRPPPQNTVRFTPVDDEAPGLPPGAG